MAPIFLINTGMFTSATNLRIKQQASDPDFSSVTLLMPFDGTDGATTATDYSYSAHVPVFAGDAQIDTSQKKFGVSSAQFDGVGGDKITIPSSSDFAFGTGDFTIECWARFSDITDINVIVWDGGYLNAIYCNANSGMSFYSDSNLINVSSGTIALNTWYHIALVRASGTFTLYTNGVSDGTSSASRTFTASEIRIGSGDVNGMNGWIDDVRITTGVARYTANFTPPESPVKYTGTTRNRNLPQADPDFDSVVLLAPFSGEDGDTTSTDLSSNSHALTFAANAALDGDIRKFGFTSCLFDGDGDYVQVANDTSLQLGSSDFTIECHIRFNGTPTATGNPATHNGVWLSKWTNAGTREWVMGWRSDGNVYWTYSTNGTNGTDTSFGAWSPAGDTWYHVAICRNGNDTLFFIDGTQFGSTGSMTGATITSTTSPVYISGYFQDGSAIREEFDGWIENVRITKGVARYTAPFTPPERAFPTVKNFDAVTNGIELFLDAGSTASYPGTGNTWTDLSPNGNNATYQETTAPFDSDGGGCFDFEDGPVSANNVFTVPDDDSIEFGEVWTACIWIKTTDTTTDQYILNKHTNRLALLNGYTNGKVDTFINGSNPSGDQSMDVSLNTWEHFTWVKDLNSENPNNFMYKNGSLVRSITASSNVGTSSETLRIGGTGTTSTLNFQGKIAILMMYKRALSAAEVLQNYNAQKSRFGL